MGEIKQKLITDIGLRLSEKAYCKVLTTKYCILRKVAEKYYLEPRSNINLMPFERGQGHIYNQNGNNLLSTTYLELVIFNDYSLSLYIWGKSKVDNTSLVMTESTKKRLPLVIPELHRLITGWEKTSYGSN